MVIIWNLHGVTKLSGWLRHCLQWGFFTSKPLSLYNLFNEKAIDIKINDTIPLSMSKNHIVLVFQILLLLAGRHKTLVYITWKFGNVFKTTWTKWSERWKKPNNLFPGLKDILKFKISVIFYYFNFGDKMAEHSTFKPLYLHNKWTNYNSFFTFEIISVTLFKKRIVASDKNLINVFDTKYFAEVCQERVRQR